MKLLTALQAADLLQIKGDTLYSLIDKEDLPAAKVGGQWRFLEEEIIDWFKSRSTAQLTKTPPYGGMESGLENTDPAMYQTLVDATFDAFIISSGNIICDCNNIAVELYGYERSEFIGTNVKTLVAPDFHEELDKTLATNRTGVIFRVHFRRDGTAFPVEVSMKSYHDGKRYLRLSAIRTISHVPREDLPTWFRKILNAYPVSSIAPRISRSSRHGRFAGEPIAETRS